MTLEAEQELRHSLVPATCYGDAGAVVRIFLLAELLDEAGALALFCDFALFKAFILLDLLLDARTHWAKVARSHEPRDGSPVLAEQTDGVEEQVVLHVVPALGPYLVEAYLVLHEVGEAGVLGGGGGVECGK